MENYFKYLHHPLEKEGVGFWWMDWQQGNNTRIEGLDPLWMLNHYHYIDNDRGERRPLMFSRYAGPGSHRYPVGFSGDTIVSWESLDFQPYFTLTASNIGYGWWSHDIGGHMFGYRDDELTARWVQFGVFSPINRLHSARSPFMGKEPWRYNKIAELSMKKFLKLRYKLMPYLYTMNYRASEMAEPIIMPMYYNWSSSEAYECKNQYSFGSEMIVSPITGPKDKSTDMGSTKVWLPKGEWYDFFTNLRYRGAKSFSAYRDLYSMPVFVKAGGIVPMCEPEGVNGIDNPKLLKLKVYAGADGSFELYEDDGKTKEYKNGSCVKTKFSLSWGENPVFKIHAPKGDLTLIPEDRCYEIEFIGLEEPEAADISSQAQSLQYEAFLNDDIYTVRIGGALEDVEIRLKDAPLKENNTKAQLELILGAMQIENDIKNTAFSKLQKAQSPSGALSALVSCGMDKDSYLALMEIICAAE